MSPKHQSTAARKARAAARTGAKYTEALRSASPDPAHPDWDDLVVSALSGVVARRGVVPVKVIWDEGARHSMVQRDNGVRWGVAEPATDGVVIREVRGDVGVVAKGTRAPVPHRLDDGQVEVAALWPLVWCSNAQPFWRYVHNGWSVDRPGALPAALDPVCPSPELPYEVRTYYVPDGIVGEDHTGGAPSWWTRAWCDSLDKAVLLADTLVAHRLSTPSRPAGGDCGDLRAEVWKHSTIDLGTLPAHVHQTDAHPDRPVVPRVPFDTWLPGRPASTEPTPEPAWFKGEKHPPTYDLRVWSERDGWETLAWFVGGRSPAGIAATLLRVGTGGPYAWAETWGPRYPDAWREDFTQEGRAIMDRHPDEPYAESSARHGQQRSQETADLAAALAARSGGALTTEQATARIEAGGQEYRDFLRVGQICITDALNEKRLAAEAGSEERMRLRGALDALENHHQVADWVNELTATHMATNPRDRHYTAGAMLWRRRALQEYLSPGQDVTGVPGLTS
ncbi:hypothetical protein ID875_21400 [Streptomyces globisporus]|uniref:Uncharacterized protein n=1 Tax=Streptomyces globisporus TaxID=1908 RepID=A0A927GPD6_STRGL|nr:hypothetical protein [Streptomyces globisporus]